MRFYSYTFFIGVLFLSAAHAEMCHHAVQLDQSSGACYVWENQCSEPFNELILSWNAKRPVKGSYAFYVSVDAGLWSEWFLYARWGHDSQRGFIVEQKDQPIKVYQDAVQVLNDETADTFRIAVVSEGGAPLSGLKRLHVCASNTASPECEEMPYAAASIQLGVEGLSQMALNDERRERLCSPTSTAAVVRYLNGNESLDPIDFSERCWDAGFDIFGNWVLNVAEAYHRINNPRQVCWVEHLKDFQGILDSLTAGFPTVISVRGPLPGSALPYKNGHLLVVIGFDAIAQEVICMDPAFSSDEETIVRYALKDLLRAWGRRKQVAYVFAES